MMLLISWFSRTISKTWLNAGTELALALEAHHEVPAAPAAAVALAAWEVEEQRTEAGALREVA